MKTVKTVSVSKALKIAENYDSIEDVSKSDMSSIIKLSQEQGKDPKRVLAGIKSRFSRVDNIMNKLINGD